MDDLPHLPLFLSAVESLGGAALLLEEDLRVAGATPSAERLLGVKAHAGAHAIKLLCGDEVDRPLAEALAAGRPAIAVVRRLRPDGTDRLVAARARPLRAHGRPIGWLLLLEEAARPDDVPLCFQSMWTRDVTVKRLFRLAEKVAQGDATVLIQGEIGTGKSSLAAAIHALSPRHAGPFVAIGCASASPPVLERALLGHARDGGTLCLDDVTELPHDAQAELLRVLETGVVTPLDGSAPVPSDLRVISTTSVSLQHAVESGRLRADLMYGLRIVTLNLPPLRARHGDVALLAEKIVGELNEGGMRRVERVAPAALARLTQHRWPGNVRELRAAIEAAFAMGEGPVLLPADLPSDITDPLAASEIVVPAPPAPVVASADEPDETTRIRRALERAAGDRAQAATMLGMSRTTLWRRMRALGLGSGGHGG